MPAHSPATRPQKRKYRVTTHGKAKEKERQQEYGATPQGKVKEK